MQRWKPGEERRFICIEVGLYYVFERKENMQNENREGIGMDRGEDRDSGFNCFQCF